MPAGRVTGADVFSSAGDRLGSVEDIAIDKMSGRVAYAILSVGGFLGIGERYHPVPRDILSYDLDRRGYVIPCDKRQLEAAPTFEADELGGWNDTESRDRIYGYYGGYGAVPYWGA